MFLDFKKRFLSIVLTTSLVVAAGAVAFPVADSHAAPSDCSAGYTCLWKDHDYKTEGSGKGWVMFEFGIPDLSKYKYNYTSYSAYKSASSLYNKGRTSTAYFYDGIKYSGSYFSMPKGASRNNLATSLSPIRWNDRIASARFI